MNQTDKKSSFAQEVFLRVWTTIAISVSLLFGGGHSCHGQLAALPGGPWADETVTISFAPDGTNVAGYESTLFQSLDALGDSSVWQDAIVRGFETWAQHTAASISTIICE